MDKMTFGLTLLVVGVGGTFLTLTILVWSVMLLKKIFPLTAADDGKSKQS
jgi:Na+-transporting methylmalonyl-CoA/oxaloacetate decarboxylase gamma subunit